MQMSRDYVFYSRVRFTVTIHTAHTKLFWFVTAILGISLYGVAGCEKSASMEVTEDNPPVINLSGDAYVDWLDVRGPLPERMDLQRPSLIWKIVPAGPLPRLKDTPLIVYGHVPEGFIQEEPKTGGPPALVEGRIYNISAVTRSRKHPYKTIVIQHGHAIQFRDEDYRVDNSNIASYVPPDVSRFNVSGHIFFVPIMNYNVSVLRELADYYNRKYGLQIEIKANLQTDFSHTYDVQRGQHVAEEFIATLKREYPESELGEQTIYIGFEPQDMYIKGNSWRYAYSYSEGPYAVVSDERLGIFASEPTQRARLIKIVTRNIGVLYYHLPPSDDPRSVRYSGLLGPDDLDRMSENF